MNVDNFPGNSYSGVTGVDGQMLTGMSNTHEMIAKAEDILWPARRAIAQVAILFPQSSPMWDLLGEMASPNTIEDFTNHILDDRTTDYLAEIWGLYQALALHKNIPVDFVDEAGLLEIETLKPFKVIFATVPDLPSAGATSLGAWVKEGGTLITVSNTGSHDEYHEPSTVLARLSGMRSKRNVPAEGGLYHGGRFILSGSGYWSGLEAVANGTLIPSLCPNATLCSFVACGAAGEFTAVNEDGYADDESPTSGSVLASFHNGQPAVKTTRSGMGHYIHFAWLPGISYSAGAGAGNPPPTTQPEQKNVIATLLETLVRQYSGVQASVQVSIDEIEAPLLSSPQGDVVTVLNHALLGDLAWTVHPDGSSTFDGNLPIALNVSLGYAPSSVLSTQLGPLSHIVSAPGWVSVKLPTFHYADMIVFKR